MSNAPAGDLAARAAALFAALPAKHAILENRATDVVS